MMCPWILEDLHAMESGVCDVRYCTIFKEVKVPNCSTVTEMLVEWQGVGAALEYICWRHWSLSCC